jgi:hypothetical protein
VVNFDLQTFAPAVAHPRKKKRQRTGPVMKMQKKSNGKSPKIKDLSAAKKSARLKGGVPAVQRTISKQFVNN